MLVPKTELRSRLPEGDQVAPEAGRDGVGREQDGRGGGRERELRCRHGLSVCCPGWPSGAYLVCWAGAAGQRLAGEVGEAGRQAGQAVAGPGQQRGAAGHGAGGLPGWAGQARPELEGGWYSGPQVRGAAGQPGLAAAAGQRGGGGRLPGADWRELRRSSGGRRCGGAASRGRGQERGLGCR